MKPLISVLSKDTKYRIAIWFMRQAGRYLPEYNLVRRKFNSFLEFCLTPDAAVEATIQPLRRFDLDAAIIFSDILVVPYAIGVKVEFLDNAGPVLEPLTNLSKIVVSEERKAEVFNKVYSAVRMVKKELDASYQNKALIGFAGSPWTVACYVIEGGGSKDFSKARRYSYEREQEFSNFIDFLVSITAEYIIGQINAGAEVIQLFDSWASLVSGQEFHKWIIKPTKKIVSMIKGQFPKVPIIGFPRGVGALYTRYAIETGVDCVSLDYGVCPEFARDNLQKIVTIQGNLDNALLFGSKESIRTGTEKIVSVLSSFPFVFNLGHGIIPGTPTDNVDYLVNIVKELTCSL